MDPEELDENAIYVEADEITWGKVRRDFCTDCRFIHEVAHVYSNAVNPMESRLLGEIWLCDSPEEDDDD